MSSVTNHNILDFFGMWIVFSPLGFLEKLQENKTLKINIGNARFRINFLNKIEKSHSSVFIVYGFMLFRGCSSGAWMNPGGGGELPYTGNVHIAPSTGITIAKNTIIIKELKKSSLTTKTWNKKAAILADIAT